jgi:hypothetical protein
LGYLGILPPPTIANMFVLCIISTIPMPDPNSRAMTSSMDLLSL